MIDNIVGFMVISVLIGFGLYAVLSLLGGTFLKTKRIFESSL